MDHAGPYPVMYGGYRYFTLFVDHGSGLVVIELAYTCTSSETKAGIQHLHTLVKTQTDTNIKRMRSDKGSDYTSHDIKEWASEVGVVLETVPPDGHGQLGQAESRIGVINRIARTLMRRAGAPHKFLFFAIQHIVSLDNRTAHNRPATSYELAWRKNSSAQHAAPSVGVWGDGC